MTSVHIKAVEKRFGETAVLHGIDAEIPQGAFAVLVGPSGCGKSTLLRLIAGLEQVSAGRIFFGEKDVTELPPRERDIAMVFQSYALYPHMTVRENMAFGLKLRKTDQATIDSRVDEVAGTLDIEHLLDRYPRQLSGGQRQRVAMGRAIVRRPALFMFDEPLSNLDPALRTQVRVDIRKLHDAHDSTSVYVTHDQVEAMTLADILFVLEGGHVQQSGPPLEIYERPANRFVAEFLGSPAMNMLPATVREGSLRFDASGAVPLEGPHAEAFGGLEEGQAVYVGVRAQDVTRCRDSDAHLTATARFVETLGSHVHVHCTVGEASFIAAFDGSRGPDEGEGIPLRIERFHVFDADSGNSLRSA
ncbi:MAG: ABC transporter ATP-binding protein [Nannocystaceae bacterium]|nr:sn-glycerol-3-phosphate ABC transporter ATP-binding protein UgpC [bacterium]